MKKTKDMILEGKLWGGMFTGQDYENAREFDS